MQEIKWIVDDEYDRIGVVQRGKYSGYFVSVQVNKIEEIASVYLMTEGCWMTITTRNWSGDGTISKIKKLADHLFAESADATPTALANQLF